jgi:hypothetical protein
MVTPGEIGVRGAIGLLTEPAFTSTQQLQSRRINPLMATVQHEGNDGEKRRVMQQL